MAEAANGMGSPSETADARPTTRGDDAVDALCDGTRGATKAVARQHAPDAMIGARAR